MHLVGEDNMRMDKATKASMDMHNMEDNIIFRRHKLAGATRMRRRADEAKQMVCGVEVSNTTHILLIAVTEVGMGVEEIMGKDLDSKARVRTCNQTPSLVPRFSTPIPPSFLNELV